jgi:hypothetical protein
MKRKAPLLTIAISLLLAACGPYFMREGDETIQGTVSPRVKKHVHKPSTS